jgi:hypothetical protein
MLPSLQTRGTAHGGDIFLERSTPPADEKTPQADEKERGKKIRRSKDQEGDGGGRDRHPKPSFDLLVF